MRSAFEPRPVSALDAYRTFHRAAAVVRPGAHFGGVIAVDQAALDEGAQNTGSNASLHVGLIIPGAAQHAGKVRYFLGEAAGPHVTPSPGSLVTKGARASAISVTSAASTAIASTTSTSTTTTSAVAATTVTTAAIAAFGVCA